jgi:ubiquinone/menaquinone biosynthesis C-methylase UbiE
MSWLIAAVYDRFMHEAERRRFGPWRRELLADLEGEVLEVGAGTGANLPHYPTAVRRVIAAEPDRAMRARLARRAAAMAGPPGRSIEVSEASLDRLPWPDARFDAVVATLVLCSVDDPGRALGEIRRVLRPGGRLVFMEHVASDEAGHRRWQRRIEPVWKRVGGNCHLTRETEQAIRDAGFGIERLDRHVEEGQPLVRKIVRGIARASS